MTKPLSPAAQAVLDAATAPTGDFCLENVNEIAAALAQPEPQGPTDEELLDLFGVVTPVRYVKVYKRELDFARAVLARWGRPAIKPVPGVEGGND